MINHDATDLPELGFQHVKPRPVKGTFEAALSIACTAHKGQLDKAGQPYIMHPIRVAQAVWQHGEGHRTVAILHDVIEDSPWSVTMLCDEFPTALVMAVDALSKRPREAYIDYLERVACNAIARLVKLADLHDNLDPRRIANTELDMRRIAKYHTALAYLTSVR